MLSSKAISHGPVGAMLEQARKELLDLGLRNTLLNYRAPKSRGVEVMDGYSAEVFKWAVRERRGLEFLPQQERLAEEPDDRRLTKRQSSAGQLQTNLTETALKTRLLATQLAARAHIEERGFNILYLALGMLHWFEDDASEKEMRAPLILIPVELKRTTARDRFTLAATEEDIEGNLSLATKLRTEFGVKFPDLPEVEDLDVAPYFEAASRAVVDMKRWRVARDEVSLGFFSFGKFLMYRDLAAQQWVDGTTGEGSPLLTALLLDGFRSDPSPVSEDQYLDALIAPGALHQVVDVDSSQALALLDIRAGRHLVIQGPPGTGKSQTITNIISDALGAGKKVLFVAEKMAALEVVKRRLDKAGIGDACLELHSHTANKKAVLGELKRTMQLGRPHLDGARFNLAQYLQLRDHLTAYCQALNAPLGDTGFTPYQLMGELVAIRSALGESRLPNVAATTPQELQSRSTLEQLELRVGGLERHLATMGVPSDHPHRHSGLTALLPSERQLIEAALHDLAQSARTLRESAATLGSFMGLNLRLDAGEADVLAKAGRRAMTAPHLRDVELSANDWQERRDDIRDLLATGAALSELHGRFDSQLIAEAWNADVLAARRVLMTTGQKWWRLLSGEYREVRRRLVGLCGQVPVWDVAGQLKLVEAILQQRRLAATFDQHAELGPRLFGVQWQGRKSEWPVLLRITEWIVELYRAIGAKEVPPGVVDFLSGNPTVDELKGRVESVEAAIPAYAKALLAVEQRLQLTQEFISGWRQLTFEHQEAQVTQWLQTMDRLPEWITYNNMSASLRRSGLGWLVGAAFDWSEAGRHLTHFFRHVALEGMLASAYAEREQLCTFSGSAQDHARHQFSELDRSCFSAAQLQLATAHWESLPRFGGVGQIGVLLREFEKKSRHLPIRKLMTEAGAAVQAIKPVFMMSPMSIASFLPPAAAKFDLVVFDEASQVKPVEAFGAVLRGEQLVVVGDSKQLPPTSFFDSMAAGDAQDDADDGSTSVTADMESILGLVAGQGAPQRMLRWHYRSRHDSLIALSNKEFYDSRLVVFPSPEGRTAELGLVFHHVQDAVYDRGRSRTNRVEAQAVAKAVMAHARRSPHLTLGVAAFSLAQADAIIDEVEKLRAGNKIAEEFFARHRHEQFFVKNLESVQGDERDVILISIGYGKDTNGYLAMSFGALNGDGGERRLNVLITRARMSCQVFSNITHNDIDLARTQSRGVAALKAFLKYAECGILDVPDGGRAEHDSIFEEQVATALESVGHKVVAQVGSGGFRIDLAVLDPERPGSYLLGIECDGATYHSSRSARDRDRLREQVLVSLGWRIHRIWSTDWFNDPQRELKRTLVAIEKAKACQSAARGQAAPRAGTVADQPELIRIDTEEAMSQSTLAPVHVYTVAQIDIDLGQVALHEAPNHALIPVISEIARIEGPVHVAEMMRRIADAVGVKRIGNRIAEHLERAINVAVRSGSLHRTGEFISVPGVTIRARDRSRLPAASRKIELIPPSEIAQAVKQVVTDAYGMRPEDVSGATARLFGFNRASADIVAAIEEVLDSLLAKKELDLVGGQVRCAQAADAIRLTSGARRARLDASEP